VRRGMMGDQATRLLRTVRAQWKLIVVGGVTLGVGTVMYHLVLARNVAL